MVCSRSRVDGPEPVRSPQSFRGVGFVAGSKGQKGSSWLRFKRFCLISIRLSAATTSRQEAEDELARAEKLIEETGAMIYAPLVRDLKVDLQNYAASLRHPADGPKLASVSSSNGAS